VPASLALLCTGRLLATAVTDHLGSRLQGRLVSLVALVLATIPGGRLLPAVPLWVVLPRVSLPSGVTGGPLCSLLATLVVARLLALVTTGSGLSVPGGPVTAPARFRLLLFGSGPLAIALLEWLLADERSAVVVPSRPLMPSSVVTATRSASLRLRRVTGAACVALMGVPGTVTGRLSTVTLIAAGVVTHRPARPGRWPRHCPTPPLVEGLVATVGPAAR